MKIKQIKKWRRDILRAIEFVDKLEELCNKYKVCIVRKAKDENSGFGEFAYINYRGKFSGFWDETKKEYNARTTELLKGQLKQDLDTCEKWLTEA